MKQPCKEVLERAYLFLDGEGLTATERVEIETHLADCVPCLEAYGVEREVVTVIIGRLRGTTHCPESLKKRIAHLLEEA
jgi:mycothiol system anti-sigma-R factor